MSAADRDRLTNRVDVGLGSFDVLDRENVDQPYATDTYDVVGGYLVTLSPLAFEVTERRLVSLTLVHTDYANGEEDEGSQLVLPMDVTALDHLIALLASSRDYIAREEA